MSNKKIILILLLLVLLPALVYTVYEASALQENKNVLAEIYDQKLNSVLFSVNQYYWDKAARVRSDFTILAREKGLNQPQVLDDFVNSTSGLSALAVTDTLLTRVPVFSRKSPVDDLDVDTLMQNLRKRQTAILRMLYRERIGYAKAESFVLPGKGEQEYLVLLSGLELGPKQHMLMVLIFDLPRFADETLKERISEFSELDIVLGLFAYDRPMPIVSTGDITLKSARTLKKLWLFPEHRIGIRVQADNDLEDLINGRFRRSLWLIFFLDLVLLLGAWILYRGIRKEVQLARMKSDFVSNVSHELRTPLALIRMFSETLEMGRVPDEEKKQQYYRMINQETIRLTHLINNILDFSKMEAERKQFIFVPLQVNQVIEQCLEFYRFHLEQNGFTLQTRLAKNLPPISADVDALTEMLINLLENSVKFSGEVKEVTISSGIREGQVFIEVADRGPGIATREQHLIFEKFYRGTDGLVHNTKGSGLGLTLVKYAMQAHGGRVQVESTPGAGSLFRLLFPVINNQSTEGISHA